MKLQNRVALITGAGSGIGEATAWRMAGEGAKIAVTGIPGAGVERVAAELVAAGHDAIAIETDVSQTPSVEAAVARTVAQWGRLDVLVPNAGIQLHTTDLHIHSLPEDVWDRTHDVNYRGGLSHIEVWLGPDGGAGHGGCSGDCRFCHGF
ncbi:MAG: SDR family NAD(P)-dependent oxidoreductase [Caldilineaceae bacterium]|nr:SDR family NAD(P)-dependent oxidoreductase [Caldilineaceae bacterium]